VRCPVNKLPLGARIVRNAAEKRVGGYTVYDDFAIFAPAWKNEVFPSGKLCDNKHGWVMSVKESINYNRDGMVVEVICVNQLVKRPDFNEATCSWDCIKSKYT
jgi:hypothetical protein